MPRTIDPRKALDYPNIPDGVYVIWYGNGVKWPAADRRLSYLSGHSRNPYALYTMDATLAATFPSEAEARAWLAEQEANRGNSYGELNVTTVAELKAACGYDAEPREA